MLHQITEKSNREKSFMKIQKGNERYKWMTQSWLYKGHLKTKREPLMIATQGKNI